MGSHRGCALMWFSFWLGPCHRTGGRRIGGRCGSALLDGARTSRGRVPDTELVGGGRMLKVRDLMTPDVVTVRPATPIKDAARLLVEHRISGMPVVDDGGQIVGVVSEGDLLVKEQDANSVDRRP